ncbi:MAG: hypothetical protein KGH64_02690 [Candidatus Micrarchaeota archaeon]|nr:hypothetical protein [Candidatus Micrarchaeota archaeon]MDE1834220.1 hypothetical protein [Candidatus Micrarchaeota archaeon]MDE1859855.1 hypothetical protein [Candidatus Micrarchaeota archaeon]
MHGAKRVIAIEGNKKAYDRMVKNAAIIKKHYGTEVEPTNVIIDNIKCDIEGGEGMVMEQHFAGYWQIVGHSKGFPLHTKVVRLTKINWLERILRTKELLVIRLIQPKEVYQSEKSKGSRRAAAKLEEYS